MLIDQLQNTVHLVCRLLPMDLRVQFESCTQFFEHPKFKIGPQGQKLEIKGEYNAHTGYIALYHVSEEEVKQGLLFYYYAHECGHKFFTEYLDGKNLKYLLQMMSNWPLNEEEYKGYRAAEKITEIFSDVFALYLRAKFYENNHMVQKAAKIRKTMDQKAPKAFLYLNKALKIAAKKKSAQKTVSTVFKGDFKRLERVFGNNLF